MIPPDFLSKILGGSFEPPGSPALRAAGSIANFKVASSIVFEEFPEVFTGKDKESFLVSWFGSSAGTKVLSGDESPCGVGTVVDTLCTEDCVLNNICVHKDTKPLKEDIKAKKKVETSVADMSDIKFDA